jgi:hypothetical protein
MTPGPCGLGERYPGGGVGWSVDENVADQAAAEQGARARDHFSLRGESGVVHWLALKGLG